MERPPTQPPVRVETEPAESFDQQLQKQYEKLVTLNREFAQWKLDESISLLASYGDFVQKNRSHAQRQADRTVQLRREHTTEKKKFFSDKQKLQELDRDIRQADKDMRDHNDVAAKIKALRTHLGFVPGETDFQANREKYPEGMPADAEGKILQQIQATNRSLWVGARQELARELVDASIDPEIEKKYDDFFASDASIAFLLQPGQEDLKRRIIFLTEKMRSEPHAYVASLDSKTNKSNGAYRTGGQIIHGKISDFLTSRGATHGYIHQRRLQQLHPGLPLQIMPLRFLSLEKPTSGGTVLIAKFLCEKLIDDNRGGVLSYAITVPTAMGEHIMSLIEEKPASIIAILKSLDAFSGQDEKSIALTQMPLLQDAYHPKYSRQEYVFGQNGMREPRDFLRIPPGISDSTNGFDGWNAEDDIEAWLPREQQ